jgi:carbamoylphosphate synthase large subunit
MLSFGGQTALNCGLELDARGTLKKYGVRVLGTPGRAIRDTEDPRALQAAPQRDRREDRALGAVTAATRCGGGGDRLPGDPPLGLLAGRQGQRICETEPELLEVADRAFGGGVPQVLVEESLRGWKEIEYEVVRDFRDNCITVCNMENFDPLGIHTGESIVVAPSQTLNDDEYQMLRSIAIKTIRHLGIVGECNIQYALDPKSNDYRVIEVNARLSRSSALASKATGYPLAYVAAKIALGYTLPDLPNAITRRTSAFFEPALDYIVCKFPRWDLQKFRGSTRDRQRDEERRRGDGHRPHLPEVLQKALRMIDIGVTASTRDAFEGDDLRQILENPSPQPHVRRRPRAGRRHDRRRDPRLSRIDRGSSTQITRSRWTGST